MRWYELQLAVSTIGGALRISSPGSIYVWKERQWSSQQCQHTSCAHTVTQSIWKFLCGPGFSTAHNEGSGQEEVAGGCERTGLRAAAASQHHLFVGYSACSLGIPQRPGLTFSDVAVVWSLKLQDTAHLCVSVVWIWKRHRGDASSQSCTYINTNANSVHYKDAFSHRPQCWLSSVALVQEAEFRC